jgi:predicted transcriptional regulator
MPDKTPKERVLEIVEQLPEDATFEDAMERLYFIAKIERGIAQADAGDTIPHDQAKRRLTK